MLKGSGTRKLGGRDSLRAFQRFLGWSLVALFVSLFPSRAHAYTWMIKHGYASCPVCHADPSGGELLTSYGRVQSDELLRMRYGKSGDSAHNEPKAPRLVRDTRDLQRLMRDTRDLKTDALSGADKDDAPEAKVADEETPQATATEEEEDEEAPPPATASTEASSSSPGDFLWGLVKTPDWLLLGGSYRHLMVLRPSTEGKTFSTFPMMADVYGQVQIGNFRIQGSLGVARVGVGSPYARAAQLTTNQGDQWNLLSRSHWLGYDLADGTMTIRAGHMNLPFGVRIPEHTMWVRQATLTDRESAQQDGVSFAYNGEKLRGEVMAIVGNYQVNPDKYRQRGYSLYAEYMVGERTGVGVSSMITKAKKDRVSLQADPLRQAHGAYVRSALTDDLVLLAEADVLFTTNRDTGYVGFAQFDYEITRGLHLMATGEVLNRGYDRLVGGEKTVGNGQPQFGAWGTVDWFFLPHCEFRADAFKRQQDDFTILGQLHVFL
ncbi:MAG TPA: hypothetical protein VJV79_04260 [Polyangiaceae bacterium]|nr:hypothetical protein [Polyangiaceae bacterium]